MDGERLSQEEILGFFQLLARGRQETTTNLINNAILCFIEHPDQLARLAAAPELLPSAIEEVLRYRSPVQWMLRDAEARRRDARPGDPGRQARAADDRLGEPRPPAVPRPRPLRHRPRSRTRTSRSGTASTSAWGRRSRAWRRGSPWPICWSVSRTSRLASDEPWEPRKALHVHGPARLPIRFEPRSFTAV